MSISLCITESKQNADWELSVGLSIPGVIDDMKGSHFSMDSHSKCDVTFVHSIYVGTNESTRSVPMAQRGPFLSVGGWSVPTSLSRTVCRPPSLSLPVGWWVNVLQFTGLCAGRIAARG